MIWRVWLCKRRRGGVWCGVRVGNDVKKSVIRGRKWGYDKGSDEWKECGREFSDEIWV